MAKANSYHIDKLARYKNYFGENGGVTISGGEPLFQINVVIEILHRCKKELQITTCIETSGIYPLNVENKLDELIFLSDTVYCDYKLMPQIKAMNCVNMEIYKTEKFLSKCPPDKTIVRNVIVPGINDTEQHVKNLASKIKSINNFKIELLPFKQYSIYKYQELGREYLFKNIRQATAQEITKLQKIVDSLI
jgi:pyruvate formate lyase activating enzyme